MQLVNFIKKLKPKKTSYYVKTLDGNIPIGTIYGRNIYASDVVKQAINCIGNELAKNTFAHVRHNGLDIELLQDNLSRVLLEPNPYMTMRDMLFFIAYYLKCKHDCYILPTYDVKRVKDGDTTRIVKDLTGLYPIHPDTVTMHTNGNNYFYRLRFRDGEECELPIEELIHMRDEVTDDDYFSGKVCDDALLKLLHLNDVLLRTIENHIKASLSINGILKTNTYIDETKDTLNSEAKSLQAKIENNESGFLLLDMKTDYIPINKNLSKLDDWAYKYIEEKILRNFGVPISILTGNYTREEYQAFYQTALEPIIINICQAFNRVLFTDRQKSYGHEIKLFAQELIFLDNNQKLTLFDMLTDTGSCYKNEIRFSFGLMPDPSFAGQLAISSNKSNAINNENKIALEEGTPDDTDTQNEPQEGNTDTTNDKKKGDEDDATLGKKTV